MSKYNKYKRGRESDAETSTSAGYTDDDALFKHQLSKARRVKVYKFKDMLLLDIREMYAKDGKSLPGHKGISLTKEQALELFKVKDEILTALGGEGAGSTSSAAGASSSTAAGNGGSGGESDPDGDDDE